MSMPYVGLTSLHKRRADATERIADLVSMPYVGLTSLHQSNVSPLSDGTSRVNALCRAHVSALASFMTERIGHEVCQCPMSGSRLCTLPPTNPSVYAGFRPCFFMYLSELSDFWVQLCQKVGKAQIVFFKAQFKDVHFIYYTSNERVRNMNATGFHCIRLLKMSLKRMR